MGARGGGAGRLSEGRSHPGEPVFDSSGFCGEPISNNMISQNSFLSENLCEGKI